MQVKLPLSPNKRILFGVVAVLSFIAVASFGVPQTTYIGVYAMIGSIAFILVALGFGATEKFADTLVLIAVLIFLLALPVLSLGMACYWFRSCL